METANVINVLSVDFDAILYPCIQLYNDRVSGNENPTIQWKILERDLGIIDHLRYDAKMLSLIQDYMQKAVTFGAKFIPIVSHEEIIEHLKPELKSGTNLDVLNIDFHHDIIYGKNHNDSIISYDEYYCGDWVGYLYLKNNLQKYRWFKAPNSSMFDLEEDWDKSLFEVYENQQLEKIVEDDRCIKGIDYVFFALSPQWVPYQYHHLYYLISQSCINSEKAYNLKGGM